MMGNGTVSLSHDKNERGRKLTINHCEIHLKSYVSNTATTTTTMIKVVTHDSLLHDFFLLFSFLYVIFRYIFVVAALVFDSSL